MKAAHGDLWRIDERAGAAPPGWPGWPDHKSFAVVLTHDVQTNEGLSRVQPLMDLELSYGFRSCFNFVPEGEDRVPATLRRQLAAAGFEVGVYGLDHEHRLFTSRRKFAAEAVRVRRYLERWDASGFRSSLMQHRLSWLHDLGLLYDSSTFDTDPFGRQPNGVGTVFPFWVPGPNGTGYVELPCTLPMDLTLFSVLHEPNIDVWKRKLDWIAARGGMALLITHPDFMSIPDKASGDVYPASHYEELLHYINERYQGAFWPALPRDVASFYTARIPLASRNTRKKICMLAYTIYERDNRVRRYAEALAKRGDQVDVIALSNSDDSPGVQIVNGVSSYHIQRRAYNERNKWTYAWRLVRFLVASSTYLTRLHHRERYDVVHIHNVPDFLAFAAWYPKLTGAKLILDIHDIVPELFASKFEAKESNFYFRLLTQIEKLSAAFVDHVIVSNHLWYERLIRRSVQREKCSVFLNHVDPEIFHPRDRTRADDKVVILFPGTFQWHQGLDIAVRALAHVKKSVSNVELHLYGGGGGGDAETRLRALANELALDGAVRFFKGMPLEKIADVMANADVGIVPKRADSFGNEAYSTKIMEFMSQGVPVVASRTKIDSYYFDDRVIRFFPSGDDVAMAHAILEIIRNQPLRDVFVANGHDYVARHGWHSKKRDYLALIDSLSAEQFSAAAVSAQPGSLD